MTVRGWSSLIAAMAGVLWLTTTGLVGTEFVLMMQERDRLVRTWAPAAAQADELARVQASTAAALTDAVARKSAAAGIQRSELSGPMDAALAALGQTLAGQPAALRLVEAARSSQAAWLSIDADPTLDALDSGNATEAAVLTTSPQATDATSAMLADSATLQARMQDQVIAQGQRIDDVLATLGWLVVAEATCFLLIIVGALSGLRLGVLRPLNGLRWHVRQATEDPSHRHPLPARGPTEIAAVAIDAEALRRELTRQIDEARAARGALQTQAPLVAHLRTLLTGTLPAARPGLSLFATTRPVQGVIGGDWWQFVPQSAGQDCLALADVSGHDWAAGLVALEVRAVIESCLASGTSLDHALARGAASIRDPGRTVPTVVVQLDLAGGVLRYANAGHPPPMIIRSSGEVRSLAATGPLLSVLGPPVGGWAVRSLPWEPGDALVAFTDGLFEVLERSGIRLSATDSHDEHDEHDNQSNRGIAPAATADGLALLRQVLRGVPSDIRGDASEFGQRIVADIRSRVPDWDDDLSLIVVSRPR